MLTPNLPQRLLGVAMIVGTVSFSLIPIVAAAKQGGRVTTPSNLKRVGFAAIQYAEDYDGGVVLTQQGDAGFDKGWPVLLSPYLPDQKAYFDPTREVVTTPTANLGNATLLWSQMTTLSINDSGYTGSWSTLTGTCTGRKIKYRYGMRKLPSMDQPEKRIAFAPTAYGTTGRGWYYFHGHEASWPKADVPAGAFSWNNMVSATQNYFPGKKIPVVRADGSGGALNPSFFKPYSEKTLGIATTAYCAWLVQGGGRSSWGSFFTND